MVPADREQAIEWLRDLFAADLTKVLLSGLILLSLMLPSSWVDQFGVIFFAVFAIEIGLRAVVMHQDYRRHQLSRAELVFLGLDVIATLSFLPIHLLWNDARLLRLFRLSRMLLLLNYWGPIVREVWFILAKRERRYQLAFVVITVVILTVSSALILEYFQVQGIDFNGDGDPGNDRSFWSMLWWAFLQLESADNLVKDPNASLGFVFSLLLTIFGLFLFSFFIGIGNSVVEELVTISKQRRLGVRKHTVICNVGHYSGVLLSELTTYYAKSLRSPRIVVLGPAERRYDYMLEGRLLRIRYRQGQALLRHDLLKVDADRATRVILLGQTAEANSDSEIVSQMLSVREVNKSCPIYAEIFRADNIPAAMQAGGEQTVPVMANRLVSLYIANLIVFPGVEQIYHELLTSSGDEIYTCIFDRGAMAGRQPPSGPLLAFGDLLERCHRAHGVILLGDLLAEEKDPIGVVQAFLPGVPRLEGAEPPAVPEVARLRGLFGIASNFEQLRGCLESLPDVSPPLPPLSAEGVPHFAVCPGASQLKSILIGGFHEGMVDFCEELILFTELAEIFIMVPGPAQVAGVIDAFLHRPDEPPSSSSQGNRVSFTRSGEAELRYGCVAGGEPIGRLRVLTGDWSDDHTLTGERTPDGHRLAELDAALLTYQPGETDPDARTALAALKLLQLKQQGNGSVKASFRLFCEFQHDEKAALFQRRFTGNRSDSTCGEVGVVAAGWLRNAFLAQAVFVPGIVTIYRELLSQAGVYVCKLLPRTSGLDPEAVISFGQLLSTLYRRDGIVVLGLELEDGTGPRMVINPQPRSADYQFKVGQLASIFAVGEFQRFPPAPPCPGCFLQAMPGPISE